MKGNKIVLMLLIASLLINTVFVYLIKFSSNDVIAVTAKPENFSQVYNLSKFDSTSYPKQSLESRFNRLYEQYLRDKKEAKDSYYANGKMEEFWYKKCMNSLRRVMVISAKLQVLETTLNRAVEVSGSEEAKKELDLLIETKGYHEKLYEMSNFYARFLPAESYDFIQQTLD